MSMNKPDIETNEETRRCVARQPILLKALLDTGKFEFDCLAYDLSLRGIRLKLDLPLEVGCKVNVKVKGNSQLPAQVVWVKGGFIGLEFSVSTDRVLETLGSLAAHLPKE